MVYQLLKLEKQVLYAIAGMTLLAAVGLPLAAPSAKTAPVILAFLAFTTGNITCFLPRGSWFEAALPISGRQLLVARLSQGLAMIWLPIAAGVASLQAARGTLTAPMLLATANVPAALTLATLGLRSIRPAQLRRSFWASYAVLFATGGCSMMASAYLLSNGHPELLTVVCLAVSAALFGWLWYSVPAAYEVVPVERGEAGVGGVPAMGRQPAIPVRPSEELRRSSPVARWLPLLRSAFDLQLLMLLFPPAMSGFVAVSGSMASTLALSPWILGVWFRNRSLIRWLGALPIRSRTVLVSIVGPLILVYLMSFCAGNLLAHARHRPNIADASVQAVDLAAMLGWMLLLCLFGALYEWRPLTRVPARVRQVALAIPACVPYVMWVALKLLSHKDRLTPLVDGNLKRVAAALPANFLAAAILLAIPLTVIAWGLDRVFAETEFAVRLRPTKEQMQQMQIGGFGQ